MFVSLKKTDIVFYRRGVGNRTSLLTTALVLLRPASADKVIEEAFHCREVFTDVQFLVNGSNDRFEALYAIAKCLCKQIWVLAAEDSSDLLTVSNG